SLGLPALCGFIGEIWVLLGTFNAPFSWAKPTAVISAFGVVLTAAYILWMIQRVYLGKKKEEYADFPDADAREVAILFPMAVLAIFLGVMPGVTFNLMNPTIDSIIAVMGAGTRMAMGG